MSIDETFTMNQSSSKPFIERPEGAYLIRRLLKMEKTTEDCMFYC